MAKTKLVYNDYYEIDIDQQKNRAYLTLQGFWQDRTSIETYLQDIQSALEKLQDSFTLMVDLTHYDGTSSGMHSIHVEAQKLAMLKHLSKIAEIFSENPMVKMFSEMYSKESGINAMAFKNKEHAERWLDLY
jgi:tRNA U34 5-methylaminomethyl-2-thiouridine-forming methyltransferase MnmC